METAIHVDEQVQKKALRRLSIIEGQVRGLRRMVEESNHIETCVTEGLQTDKKQQHQDELMDLIYKLSK